MKRNTLLTVRRIHHAYVITLAKECPQAELFYAPVPYAKEKKPLGKIFGTQRWLPFSEPQRMYFCLYTPEGETWAADPAVEAYGIENFRDMGGYLTQEGRQVKWGTLFRSGIIQKLEGAELSVLEGLGIRHIFDYRALNEAANAPDAFLKGAVNHLLPAMNPAEDSSKLTDMNMVTQLQSIRTEKQGEEMWEMFSHLYDTLPLHNPAYQTLFDTLLQNDGAVLQHCTAGKDRTGVGCALTLLALGVDEKTVMEDYLLSSIFREDCNETYLTYLQKAGATPEALRIVRRMLNVSPELLNRSLNAIHSRYDGLETFFCEEYGLHQEKMMQLRELYTLPLNEGEKR